MGAKKYPVATQVELTEFGAFCGDRRCGSPLYLDRIDRGKGIYRHVYRTALCQRARDFADVTAYRRTEEER